MRWGRKGKESEQEIAAPSSRVLGRFKSQEQFENEVIGAR
jgi:hypothetical protein